jgi:phage shock protein A
MTRFVLTSAVCLALTASSAAFVSRASFVAPHTQHTLPATYTHGSNLVTSSRGGYSSSTAMQMNLFDRFSRVAKSNLNNILQNLEDPEKIMGQALEDMQVSELVS